MRDDRYSSRGRMSPEEMARRYEDFLKKPQQGFPYKPGVVPTRGRWERGISYSLRDFKFEVSFLEEGRYVVEFQYKGERKTIKGSLENENPSIEDWEDLYLQIAKRARTLFKIDSSN